MGLSIKVQFDAGSGQGTKAGEVMGSQSLKMMSTWEKAQATEVLHGCQKDTQILPHNIYLPNTVQAASWVDFEKK